MKIRSIFLFTVFTLLASQVFARESVASNNYRVSSIGDTKIENFDFPKLFSEAEAYFKAAKAWDKLKCEPKSGFICTKRECAKRTIKAILILDKKQNTIKRCEDSNCEEFAAEFNQTGAFVNIQTEGPVGTLIRILGDSRYKEITTVGLDAYIANGNCEVITE
jgi:hypothetical protein